jgi:hypothetical protein
MKPKQKAKPLDGDITEPVRRTTGRPSTYTPEIGEIITDRLSQGELLIKICQDEDMPPRKTIYTWMTANPAFKEAYARARLAWADWWAERVLAISLDSSGDIFVDENGKAVIDHANVQRARLQSDTIKWLVGKYAPRTYGDKLALDAPGAAGGGVERIERLVIHWDKGPPQPPPLPPAQLTYEGFIELVRAHVPRADDRDPMEVISEVLAVTEAALRTHYGKPIAHTENPEEIDS